WERDHLWLYLLALGFDPKEYPDDMKLGRDMFDKPNHKAFAAIALFLFGKLDKDRAEETFHERTFIFGSADRQFRKQCCTWLREISNQKESGLPSIAPSSLICPGGAKFVHLVYRFARHVMAEEIKKLSVGAGIPFAEAVRLWPEDKYIAEARHRVAYNKLLQVLQKEDFVIQEYGKKSEVLIKEIEEIKSEYALMEIESLRMKQNDQKNSDTAESIQKVRGMWAHIMEMLASLKQEREIVDSVLEDCVNQCILDGSDVVLRVPRLLAHRIESGKNQVFTANVYEDGKLNVLSVIQLLNEALRMLRDEHSQPELKDLHGIENMVASCRKALQNLDRQRLEREQRHCLSVRESISRKEEDWEMKWKTFLGQHPFKLILKEDLVTLPVQSPSLPEEDENSDLHQYVASISDVCDSLHKECYEQDEGALKTLMDKSSPPPKWISSMSLGLTEISEDRDLLIENNLHTETCEGNKKHVPPKISTNRKEEFPILEMQERADEDVTLTGSPVEEELLEKARDELAEEVAKAVISESLDSGEEKGITFDDLIRSLCFNPFTTRNQIPRTPENLLAEIRSSWRKTIQTEDSSNIELSSGGLTTPEAPVDATLMQEAIDSSFVCFVPATSVSDSESPLSAKNSQLSSTDSSPQEQGRVNVFESSDSKTSEILETERTEAQELDCTALSGSSVEDLKQALQNVEKSMHIPDTCLEDSCGTNVLPTDHCRHSSTDSMLCWNVSPLLSPFSSETAYMEIWNETLPEYDSLELDISAGFEFFDLMDCVNVKGDLENPRGIEESDLDTQFLSSSCEALNRTASEIEEELCKTHNRGESESCRLDLSPAPEGRQRNKFCHPAVFLDEEFTKTPLSKLNERQYSLSSLLTPSEELQEMASMAHEIPLDSLRKLNGK
ncbi:HAUS6 protein, partial [Grallaria varia]|nr:HAUS6 protein [Grallaria varia]